MKKQIAGIVVATMITTMTPTLTFASDVSDIPNNWSKNALEAAVNNGLLKGDNGKILPNDSLTRAQMATIVNRAFGAIEKASIANFSDVDMKAWYYEDMAKAVQMQTFMGSNNQLNPNSKITREEAFVVLARAFKLSGADNIVLNKFTDKDMISSWAKDGISALVSEGYLAGSEGKINPRQYITRAEFAQIMNHLIEKYIQTPGTYTTDMNGNVMVNVPGTLLKDMTIKGNLIVGDGVGNGEVTLDNVEVTGMTIIRGGGVNSIKIIGKSKLKNIIVARVNGEVRVYTEDGTQVGDVIVDGKDDVIVEGSVGIIKVVATDITVMANNAKIETATVDGNNSKIVVNPKTIINTITLNAKNGEIVTEKGAEIKKVIANEDNAKISGLGTVSEVKANADNITVKTNGTSVVASQGTTGVVAGNASVEAGNTKVSNGSTSQTSSGGSSSGGGGGGSSSSTTVAVNSIIVASTGNAVSLVNGETLQMNAAVSPTNATNKTITWSVINGTGSATIDTNGLLTATGVGTVTVKATNTASGVLGQLTVTVGPTLAAAVAAINGADATGMDAAIKANAATLGLTLTDYNGLLNKSSVITAMVALNGADKANIVLTFNTAVAAQKSVEALAAAKVSAKAELTTALGTYLPINYTPDHWTALTSAKTSGDTAINLASDLAGVDSAKNNALQAMDAVKSIAETLADAKTEAKAGLSTALKAYTQGDYTTANWDILINEKAKGDTAIDVAIDLVSVANAKTAAISAMGAIKTIAQSDAEALALAVAAINGADVAGMDEAIKANSAILGITLTDYKNLSNNSSVITAMVALNGADKANIVLTFNTAVAAQKSVEALAAAVAAINGADATNMDAAIKANGATLGLTLTDYEALSNKSSVITAMVALDGADKDRILSTFNAAVTAQKSVEALAAAKVSAKAELTNALGTYTEASYTQENWITLTSAKTSGDTAIDLASELTGVASAKNNALQAMDAVKSIAETLADAKTEAKAGLTTALKAYTQGDYTTANWDILINEKAKGDTAIDVAIDLVSVANAKTAAISAMGAIKTIAQSEAEALAVAVAAINGADSTEMDAAIKANAATLGLTLTDYKALSNNSSVITAMVALNGADKANIVLTFNTAVAAQKSVEAVAAAKVSAKAELITALGTYAEANYTPENWITLTSAKASGDTAIDLAADLVGVASAKTTAINTMDAVKTIAETLADAKTEAKAGLTTALKTYTQGDYTTENWDILINEKAKGDTAIDVATDLVSVANAKTAAIGAMGAIKTIAQSKAEALAAAVAAINGADATGMDAAIKANATTLGLTLTDYDALLNKSSVITAMVALNGADKDRILSTFNTAVEAQKIVETTVTSKQVTNFNYETVDATSARLDSKTVTVADYTGNPKSFTIVSGADRIPVNVSWKLSTDFTAGQAMGGVVDSAIQQYFLDKGGTSGLMNRTVVSFGFNNTFCISSSTSGSSSSITLEGNDWSYFFEKNSSTGTNTDTSKNRKFSISDGINTANIVLEWDCTNMDGLIDIINSQMGTVKAKAEKVDESSFKIVLQTGGKTITISGADKDQFF